MTRTVYVVDDEDPIRRALRLMLTVQGYAVSLFSSGPALLDVVNSLVPGSVLLDVRMPEMDGIEVQRHLNQRRPELPVVVMTGHGDVAVAVAALQAGAISFVEKPFNKAMLTQALKDAFLKLEDPKGFARLNASIASRVGALAEDDRAVLSAIASGRSNDHVADDLGISATVVEARRARILAELELENVNDLLRAAFAAGYGPRSALRDNT